MGADCPQGGWNALAVHGIGTKPHVFYAMRKIHGHPLATKDGSVAIHRKVLFEKIGWGPHNCHWCNISLEWTPGKIIQNKTLISDHLDFDTRNNSPENLVPSCHGCNKSRSSPSRKIEPGEPFLVNKNGTRVRANPTPCMVCEKIFMSRISSMGNPYKKACSRECSNALRGAPGKKRPKLPSSAIVKVYKDGNRAEAEEKKCIICSSVFLAAISRKHNRPQAYCSRACFVLSSREERICSSCGAKFIRKRSYNRNHQSPVRFCSLSCRGRYFGKINGFNRMASVSSVRAAGSIIKQ